MNSRQSTEPQEFGHSTQTDSTPVSSEISSHIYKVLFDTSSEAMLITDANAKIIDVNPAFCKITGYQRDEVIGRNPKILSSGIQDSHFYATMWNQIHSDQFWQGEIWNKRKDDKIFPVWQTINQVIIDNHVKYYISVFSDISKFKDAEKKLWQLAHYDSLTGLANRNLLEIQLRRQILKSSQNNRHSAVLFLDLDDFKRINDSLGHKTGDQFLIQVAKRLKQIFRDEDTIVRIGGDEFVILLSNLASDKDDATEQVTVVIHKLLASLREPFRISQHELHIFCSIGISLFSDIHKDPEQIVKEADAAMYEAKRKGKNDFSFFYSELQAEANKRLQLEKEMYLALAENQFKVFYQLQFNQQHKILGCEALIRWQHPEKGLVSPADFIPIAEQTGLIIDIGEQVIRNVCLQLAQWQRTTDRDIPHIAINISTKQFSDDAFIEKVTSIIKDTGVDPNRIILEITESLIFNNVEQSIDKMHQLRQLGLRFSIDDFGTGYSSLSYLSRLPIDQLKVDRSFVSNLDNSPSDLTIIDTIIAMAIHLGLDVIAEGVETESQLQALIGCGCHCFQGFYFCKPLPHDQLFC